MRGMVKLISLIFGTLLTLFLIGAAFFLWTFDPNAYKDLLSREVYKATGRELFVDGNIELSVFPWLGVRVDSVRVGNPRAFSGISQRDFMRVDELQIHADVKALLQQKLYMSEVRLRGVDIVLLRNTSGRDNWTFAPEARGGSSSVSGVISGLGNVGSVQSVGFVGTACAANTAENTAADSAKASPRFALTGDSLKIESVSLENANISFSDAVSGTTASANDVNMSGKNIAFNAPVPLKASAKIRSNATPYSAEFAFEGVVQIDDALRLITVHESELTSTLYGNELPKDGVSSRVTLQAKYDLATQLAEISRLVAAGAKGGLEKSFVELAGTAHVAQQRFDGNVRLESNVREALNTFGVTLETMPTAALQRVTLSSAVKASLLPNAGRTVHLPNVDAMLDDTHITGALRADSAQLNRIAVTLVGDSVDLEKYVILERADSGEAGVQNMLQAALLPRLAHAAPVTPNATAASVRDENAPFLDGAARAYAQKVTLNVSAQLGNVRYRDLSVRDIALAVEAKGGLWRLSTAKAAIDDGGLSALANARITDKSLPFNAQIRIAALPFEPMSSAFLKNKRITGLGHYTTTLQGNAQTMRQLRASLTGNGTLSVQNMGLEGVQIVPDTFTAFLRADSKLARLDKLLQEPYLESVQASYTVQNGIVRNNDLYGVAKGATVQGAGTVNLVSEAIGYRANVTVDKVMTLPLKISGTLSNPHYGVENMKVTKDAVNSLINILVKKEQQKKAAQPSAGQENAPTQAEDVKTNERPRVSPKTEEIINHVGGALQKLLNK